MFKKLNTNNKTKNKNSSPAQQFTVTSNFGFWEKKGDCQTSYSHSFTGRKNKFSASKIKVSSMVNRLLACWQCASTNQSHRPQNGTAMVKQKDSADRLQKHTQLCGGPSALAQLSPVGGLEDGGWGWGILGTKTSQ